MGADGLYKAPPLGTILLQVTLSWLGSGLGMLLFLPVARWIFPRARDPAQARGEPGGDMWAGDALYYQVFLVLIIFCCVQAVRDLGGSAHSRFFGVSAASYWGCILFVGRMAAHMLFLVWKGLNAKRKALLVHHSVVIMVYGGGLVSGTNHYWGSASAMCEITNIFQMNLELFQCCTDAAKVKQGSLFRLNSLLLTLSYLLFRMLLFPAVFTAWLSDVLRHPEVAWSAPELGVFSKYFMPACILGVWATSVREFRNALRGTLKVYAMKLEDDSWCICCTVLALLAGARLGWTLPRPA